MDESSGLRLYSCSNCGTHVSLHADLISKNFKRGSSRAYLFTHAKNINIGPKEERQLITGLYTVSDISCCECHQVLGWKYERAPAEAQKYKEGKFVMEILKISKENW